MKKKILALLLTLCMVLPLLPLVGMISLAEDGIMYYDENGSVQYYTGPVRYFTNNNTVMGEYDQTTWYYINESIQTYHSVTIRGDVHVILGNGVLFDQIKTPDDTYPVWLVRKDRTLTFYAQSKDESTCGVVKSAGMGYFQNIGDIVINGGKFELGRCLEGVTGIGWLDSRIEDTKTKGGHLTINGGYVYAVGAMHAAAIGGSLGSCLESITINGGYVHAEGNYGSPGIGSGRECNTNQDCTITINGGTVYAKGGEGAPGIGSGFGATNNTFININGGDITAIAGEDHDSEQKASYYITERHGGAAIGAGAFTRGAVTVNITGGSVNATATNGAAIGGGEVDEGNTIVNIMGGVINASSADGAGIGSAYNQRNSSYVEVEITGGDVTAQSTNGKGIGDGANTNKAHVTLAGTDIVRHRITANSYNDNTYFAEDYKVSDAVGTTKITSASEAAGQTIRPIAYDYEFGRADGPYIEMTGCEKMYLDEYLADAFLPFLLDRVIYVVDKDMTTQVLAVTGTTILFLRENATLTVTDGIYVVNDETYTIGYGSGNLIIVAEKEDSGKLVVGPAQYGAAIGSYVDENNGTVYKTGLIRVYSGTVEAHGAAGYPAIGGKNLEFSMYGGVVKAYGGEGAPGIGPFPGDTGACLIDIDGGQLVARGGSNTQPVGLGSANATINVGWNQSTDSLCLDPCLGTVTIDAGKEFKYLNSTPVRAAYESDFATGGIFAPHKSTYYIDENGIKHQVDDFIQLTGIASTDIDAEDGAWYLCVNPLTNPLQLRTITVTGTMNLILADSTELRPDNIVVKPGATLNVYGQSDGTGLLRVNCFAENRAAIGGGSLSLASFGTVNLYGGKVIARGGKYAAAIGGAGTNSGGGTVNIYGGDVTTIAGSDGGSGIGNGDMQTGAVINYYGGRINAGSVSGTLHFIGHFFYEDDGTYVFEDEYDASRTIIPGLPEAAEYIDENGDEQSTYDYKHLRENETTLTGVYYIFEDTTLTYRPHVSGTAALILKDGVTLTAPLGIGVNEGNTLKIYAHSTEEETTGALVAGPAESMHAALGGDGYQATGTQEENYVDSLGSGNILIAGGKVTATAGTAAAAIGSGMGHFYRIKAGGSVTITGGFVTATGDSAPAIGAGSNVPTAVIHISGGVVNATGGSYGAGIGATAQNNISNTSVYSFEIVISGGSVTAKGGYASITNIGTTYENTAITISGGVIDASYTGHHGFSVGSANTTSISITADDPALSLKYSEIRAAAVNVDEGLAYTDGTVVTTPLQNNRTIVNLAENFARITLCDSSLGLVQPFTMYYVKRGELLTPPDALNAPWEGYHFAGWCDYEYWNGNDTSNPELFEFEYRPIEHDLCLVAYYEKNVYTVTFDPDNGTEEPFTQEVKYNDTADVPTQPTKAHATFDGWFEEGASTAYDFNTPITDDLTLTAHWTFTNVTVTFDTLDGHTTTQTVAYGGHATRPSNDPTRTGYIFNGWRIAQDYACFDFENETLTDDLTIYAVWTYRPYTGITGTLGASSDEDYDKLLDNNALTKWCVTSFTGCSIEFKAGDYIVPTGYIFTTANDTADNPDRNPKGWRIYGKYSKSDVWTLITSVSDNTTMTGVNYTPFIFDMTNTTAYRYFKLEITSINGGRLGVFQLSEFSFIVDSITPIPDLVVSFNAGTGSGSVNAITAKPDDSIVLPDGDGLTPPEGKIFSGWTDGTNDYAAGDNYTPSANVTMTAVYVDAYTVTYTSEYLDQTTEDYPFPAGTTITLPGNEFGLLAPEGMIFAGWAYNGTTYEMGDEFTLNADVVFTAVWVIGTPWQILQAQLEDVYYGPGYITLTEDVIASDDDGYLFIPENQSVTIDLNGHKIDRALTEVVSEGMVFQVYGELTVCDTSDAQNGMITGGFNEGDGGGVYVHYTGRFTLESGTITGNCAGCGAGVEARGTFIMTGGVITGNTAYYYGGGFEMWDDYCWLELSGSAQIYGNFAYDGDWDSDPFENNVGLYSNQYIWIDDVFTSDARIGVSTTADVDEWYPFVFTENFCDADISPFFSDNSDYTVGLDYYGEVQLMVPSGLFGDINEDGELNIADVTALLGILAGDDAQDYLDIADLNDDGEVNIGDVTSLLGLLAQN